MRFCNEADCSSVLQDWVQRIKLSMSSNACCLSITYVAVDIELCQLSIRCFCVPYKSAFIQNYTLSRSPSLARPVYRTEAWMLRDRPVTAFAYGDTIKWTLCVPSKLGSTRFVFRLHYVERRLSIYRVTFRALMMMCVVFYTVHFPLMSVDEKWTHVGPLASLGLCETTKNDVQSWVLQGLCFVTGLLPRSPRFDPRPAHLGFVVGKVALGHVSSEYYGFPLSLSFHQCSILIYLSPIR